MKVYHFYSVISLTVFFLSLAFGNSVFYEEPIFEQQPDGKIFLKDHIVGGQVTFSIHYPYLAFLRIRNINGFVQCTGSLIAEYWILTAAHCFKPERTSLLYSTNHTGVLGVSEIILGEIPNDQVFNLINPFVHPKWSNTKLENDIAMIALDRKIKNWTHIKVINLSQTPFYGSTAVVAGWGIVVPKTLNLLKFIKQKIMGPNSCPIIRTGAVVDERVLCAKALKAGESTCKGDSGSPLVVNYFGELYQVGLVSYGTSVCDASKPDIYTSVSYFSDWINRTMEKYIRYRAFPTIL